MCMVLGAWCMLHGAWCMVHVAWCMVHGAWYVVHGCMGHGAWGMVHNFGQFFLPFSLQRIPDIVEESIQCQVRSFIFMPSRYLFIFSLQALPKSVRMQILAFDRRIISKSRSLKSSIPDGEKKLLRSLTGETVSLASYLDVVDFIFDVNCERLQPLADLRSPGRRRSSRNQEEPPVVWLSSSVSHADADKFFFSHLGCHVEGTDSLIGVVSSLSEAAVIALLAYRMQEVAGTLVVYISLLATRTGRPTFPGAGEWDWRCRGFGRLLLHLVARFAQMNADGRLIQIELQYDRKVDGLCHFYTSCGFQNRQTLTLGGELHDGFTAMRWCCPL